MPPKRSSRCSRRIACRRRCCSPGPKASAKRRSRAGIGARAARPARTDRARRSQPAAQPRNLLDRARKLAAEKRNEDPLLFASHPDFVTFAPDGPLRQISIQQTRLLKERAQYLPHKGSRRVFLIDHVDRANEQAANSLLKTLEEPPAHLILIMTAENAYDLLPTIRSRAVPFHFAPLARGRDARVRAARAASDHPERRVALAAGSPGIAVSLDLEAYDKRRAAMLTLLKVAAGMAPFGAWLPVSEAIGRSKSEKLEFYFKVLYDSCATCCCCAKAAGNPQSGHPPRTRSAAPARCEFAWIRTAVARVDELVEFVRREYPEVDRARLPDRGAAGSRAR